MRIKLYKNLSESNVANKTLTNEIVIDGVLRDGSSVTDPVLLLELPASDVSGFNYLWIDEWNRYYFVKSIVSTQNNLWSFSCHIDVLTTYKEYLLDIKAIIARQESFYNLYLDDDKFLVNAQRKYWTKAFPNRVRAGNEAGAVSCIITIAGGEEASSPETTE